MKKLLSFVVMIGLVLALCGCGSGSASDEDSSSQNDSKYEEALEIVLDSSANIVEDLRVSATVGDVISFMYRDPAGGMSVEEQDEYIVISFTGECCSDMSLLNDGIYPMYGTMAFAVDEDGTCSLHVGKTSPDAYAAFLGMALALG